MRAQMNLNDYVTVQLTPRGVFVLRQRHDQRQRMFKELLPDHEVKKFEVPENNMYTAQMWQLFEVFGEYMGLGSENVFELNVSLHKVQADIEEEKR